MRNVMVPRHSAPGARTVCFIRDDDAGWQDEHLFALLDVTARCHVPIDLAAIPCAVTDALASQLRARMAVAAASAAPIGIHQHGYAHLNHEPADRKCEFGPSRALDLQRQDLFDGQARLLAWFGDELQPFFTPPWNRCTEGTADLLAALGFQALSRDRSAKPQQAALAELAIDVDWSKHWREGGAPAVVTAFYETLRQRAADGLPLGLMLHHGVMTPAEHALLSELLQVTAEEGLVQWCAMRDVLVGADQAQGAAPCARSA